jgi:hypothetical protein
LAGKESVEYATTNGEGIRGCQTCDRGRGERSVEIAVDVNRHRVTATDGSNMVPIADFDIAVGSDLYIRLIVRVPVRVLDLEY